MYYDPRVNKSHGLPHDPFTSLVVPRPIGWISTIDATGLVNLAPYSFFNAVASRPPHVMFASDGRKDSLRNAEATGEFVCNLATWELREEMNLSSAAVGPQVSEPDLVRLEMTPSVAVRPPRVKRSPVALECRYVKTIEISGEDDVPISHAMVLGRVVGIYVDDAVIKDGRVDLTRIRPISRLGYMDYATVEDIFSMRRPGTA